MQTQPYVIDNICDLITSPTPADDKFGEDAKSRNEFDEEFDEEFEAFLLSQEAGKTNSLW